MIRFAHPEYLYALALLPVMLASFVWANIARRRAMQQLGNPDILRTLIPSLSPGKRGMKSALILLGCAFLVLGLANPQIGTRMEEVKREGVDIFIALDVSASMKAEDIKPNRLENAKRQIALLLDKLQNDRIGLIVFAGESYLQLPLTADYDAARLFLSTIDVDVVPVPGTAIGSAIRLAMTSFVEGEKKHRVLIVITDGENHEDDAIAAAKDAATDGIVVHTIGMGSPLGTPIPVYNGNIQIGYKQDSQGNTVLTKLDETTLQQIAGAGNGKYVRATSQQHELDSMLKEIESMEKKEFGSRVFTEFEDRFQYALLIALFLTALEFFISERSNPVFQRWRELMIRPSVSRKESSPA